MQQAYGIHAEEDNARAVVNGGGCVGGKAPSISPCMGYVASALPPASLVVSIMAGVTSETIAEDRI